VVNDFGRLVVVGGGPVGVVTALAAAQRGFPVTLIEAEDEVDENPRAATFHPSTIEMVATLGFTDDFIASGLVSRYFDYWDKPTLTLAARMDHEVLKADTPYPFVVQTEQHKLVRLALSRLAAMDNVDLFTGWSAESVTQDADGVTVTAARGGEQAVVAGAWAVGADGARSTVRKLIGIEFEGYTWPEQFLVITSKNDYAGIIGCSYRSYFADPGDWVNLFKVAGNDMTGQWRTVFASQEGQSEGQALGDESVHRHLRPLLGGQDPQVIHKKVYNVHQRVAASFRRGRVFLAGDAAHANNPIGGLGLNCGVHDAMELVDSLEAVARGEAGEDVLDRYERRRRQLNIEFVQRQTVDNKRRLEEKDPAARRRRLDDLAAVAADPVRAREFLRRTSLLESVRRAAAMA
jgi:3-(3-hydroxy-phenyl)propionate hydroxylase